MTKITIDVDGSASVQPPPPAAAPADSSPGAGMATMSSGAISPGDVDGGSASSASAAQEGPVAFTASASQVSFDRASAISAGPAPAHLMNVRGNGAGL